MSYIGSLTFLGVAGVASGMEIFACWCSERFSYLCLMEGGERGEGVKGKSECNNYFRDWSSKSQASQAAFRSSSNKMSFLELGKIVGEGLDQS